jgi:soluble P-type ATPase
MCPIGNGNNDSEMVKNAILGIAIIGDEGCATPTLLQSDISCTNIADALELLLNEKRLIATLRR